MLIHDKKTKKIFCAKFVKILTTKNNRSIYQYQAVNPITDETEGECVGYYVSDDDKQTNINEILHIYFKYYRLKYKLNKHYLNAYHLEPVPLYELRQFNPNVRFDLSEALKIHIDSNQYKYLSYEKLIRPILVKYGYN